MRPDNKLDMAWEKLYQTSQYIYGTEPNCYLQAQRPRLRPGMKTLAIGDGEGRNGIWLASLGLSVTSVDLSWNAIEKARRLAEQRTVSLTFECCNLLEWNWPKEEFDLVVSIFVHFCERERRIVHRKVVESLKQNGLLILESFHQRHCSAGPAAERAAATFCSADMLRQDFRDLHVIELREDRVLLDEGAMHQGKAEIVRLIAQK